MSDKPQHTAQLNEVLRSSALIQRLDRRRTQPIGLINTSQSQRSLSRLPATMVQRFSLLDQIQTRYNSSSGSSNTGTKLSFATLSSKTTAEQPKTFTSEAATTQPGTSTLSSANQGPTAQFRISRRAVSLRSESSSSKAVSGPLSSPAQSTSPSIMRKDTTENLEEEGQQGQILRTKPLANNISRPTQIFSSTQAEVNNPLVMRKDTTKNLEEEGQRQPESVAVAREIPSNIAFKPPSTMVLRQNSQVAVIGNNFSQASNSKTNSSFPLPITPVHHNAIARQVAPVSMSRTIPRSNTTMSMPRQASMPMPDINVAEIAEQVSRILCRQLTVERERRGMRK